VKTGFEPKSVANLHPAQTGGSQVGRGIQREGDTLSNRSRSRGILLSLSLTLIKAIAQSVKNDFIPALGQQGLVG
jgi:hypothetical protein